VSAVPVNVSRPHVENKTKEGDASKTTYGVMPFAIAGRSAICDQPPEHSRDVRHLRGLHLGAAAHHPQPRAGARKDCPVGPRAHHGPTHHRFVCIVRFGKLTSQQGSRSGTLCGSSLHPCALSNRSTQQTQLELGGTTNRWSSAFPEAKLQIHFLFEIERTDEIRKHIVRGQLDRSSVCC
jgi:hypothetical protein